MAANQILYGSIWPADHIFADLEEQLMETLSQATASKARICRYTDEGEMLADVQRGHIHIASTSDIQSSVPEAAMMYLPFLYQDMAHFRRIWTLGANEVVLKLEELIRSRARLEPLGYSIVGPRDCILIDQPIETLADFKGLNIRIDEAMISRRTFEALGTTPTEVPFYEVKNALATRLVTAAENAPFNMIALGWHSVCKFVSQTEHRFLLNYELASEAFWGSLCEAARENTLKAFVAYLTAFADRSDVQRSSSLDALSKTHGLAVNRIAPNERDALRAASEHVIATYSAEHELEQDIEWIRQN